MANFEEVAKQFVQFYYDTFDSNRAGLGSLYRDHSMMTFESSPCGGLANIVEKLTALPFSQIKHEVATLDAQPTGESTKGILVMVTGALLVEAEQRPMSYSQVFHLLPEGQSYYVYNDIFKLVYPAVS